MRLAGLLLLCVALVACGVPVAVPPRGVPAPPRPSPMCVVGVDVFDCWIEPAPGRFEFACPVREVAGGPAVGVVNVAQPGLCPQPLIPERVSRSCVAEADLKVSEAQAPAEYGQRVFAAMNTVQPSSSPAESLQRLGAALEKTGLCVTVGVEALFLRRSDGLFEEWHAVYFGNGSWVTGPGAFKGLHRLKTAPAGTPASSGACGEPRPAGLAAWGLHPQPPAGYWDCSPLTGPDVAYCEAVGLPFLPDGVQRRSVCAVRPDEHPERVACEALILGGAGVPAWSCDAVLRQRGSGGPPALLNPYLGSCPSPAAHFITVCGNLPGAACRSCPLDGAFDSARCVDWNRP